MPMQIYTQSHKNQEILWMALRTQGKVLLHEGRSHSSITLLTVVHKGPHEEHVTAFMNWTIHKLSTLPMIQKWNTPEPHLPFSNTTIQSPIPQRVKENCFKGQKTSIKNNWYGTEKHTVCWLQNTLHLYFPFVHSHFFPFWSMFQVPKMCLPPWSIKTSLWTKHTTSMLQTTVKLKGSENCHFQTYLDKIIHSLVSVNLVSLVRLFSSTSSLQVPPFLN